MPSLVLDTHALVWYTTADSRLSHKAAAALSEADKLSHPIYIPPVCIVECIYLTEKGRIPNSALHMILGALGNSRKILRFAPFDLRVIDAIHRIPRHAVPDLPDRIIAGTALALGLPLVSRDGKIRASSIETVW